MDIINGTGRYLNENRKIILIQPNTDYLMLYEFVKNDCWYLSSTDNRSFTGGQQELHWLDNIYPSMDDCTPYHFYFEKESKRTSNRILERKGYYPYKVDEEVARYKLHEKFMGLDATEIAIPSNTYAIHMITVPVNVKRLAAAIKNNRVSVGHCSPRVQSSIRGGLPRRGRQKQIKFCVHNE